MDKIQIGINIKKARGNKKMTQQQLADIIDKTESSIRKYEKGLVQIPNDVLQQIAIALEIPIYKLMGFDELIDSQRIRDELTFISYLESLGYEFKSDMNPIEWDEDPDGVKFPIAFDESPSAPVCILTKDGVQTNFTNKQFEEFQETIKKSVEFEIFKASQK